MLVLGNDRRRGLAAGRNADREDFLGKEAGLAGRFELGLRRGGEAVGLFTADAEVTGHVVAGLRHAVVAELGNDLRVREARADGAVVQGEIAAVGLLGL